MRALMCNKAWGRTHALGSHHSDTGLGHLRLQQGQRLVGKERWDEVRQAHTEVSSRSEIHLMEAAQDRGWWEEQ